MSNEIKAETLPLFLTTAKSLGIDFPYYAYQCGCSNFVKQHHDYDTTAMRSVTSYSFKDTFVDPSRWGDYPYYVAYIPSKSYIMYETYEKGSEIMLWVCYTEEKYRKQGYMKQLLSFLKYQNEDKPIVIDTYDEHLKSTCIDLGIKLFPR